MDRRLDNVVGLVLVDVIPDDEGPAPSLGSDSVHDGLLCGGWPLSGVLLWDIIC